MSTTTLDHDETDTPAEHVHTHPSDAQYVKIAAILAVVTGLEVSTYFWKDIFGSTPSTTALVLTLFPMMIFKFFMVAGYFMHLRYDHPLFRRFFVGGLVLAIIVYCIMLSAMEYWSADYLKFLRR
jgi:cytochrome c oxidase subunit 4